MKRTSSKKYPGEQANPAFPEKADGRFDVPRRTGTFNVQATADTDDLFPAIAQGLPRHLNHTTQ